MRTIYTLIGLFLFFFLHSAAYAQSAPPKNDWEEMGLKGKVKSLTEIEYRVQDSSGAVQKLYKGTWVIYYFNEQGNIIQKLRNDPHTGKLKQKNMYSYDEAGKLTKINDYDEQGKITGTSYFIYNEKGNQTEENIFGPDSTPDAKYVSKFDEKGNRVETIGYNPSSNDAVFMKELITYDDKGNMIERSEYDEKDLLFLKTISTYDNKSNKMISSCDIYPDAQYKTTYVYNKEGYLIQTNWGGVNGTVEAKNIYNLDAENNWISITGWSNKVPGSLKERAFEYF